MITTKSSHILNLFFLIPSQLSRDVRHLSITKPQPMLAHLSVDLSLSMNQSQPLGFPLTQRLDYQRKRSNSRSQTILEADELMSWPAQMPPSSASSLYVCVHTCLPTYMDLCSKDHDFNTWGNYSLSVSMKHTELILKTYSLRDPPHLTSSMQASESCSMLLSSQAFPPRRVLLSILD